MTSSTGYATYSTLQTNSANKFQTPE